MLTWNAGDWAIFDLRIVQIKRLAPFCEVSDGSVSTSGSLIDRLRPLTLTNKGAAEYFGYWCNELRKIRGERGFNYPDIHRYFCDLALKQIDEAPEDRSITEKAPAFVRAAQSYQPVIDGVNLFRES